MCNVVYATSDCAIRSALPGSLTESGFPSAPTWPFVAMYSVNRHAVSQIGRHAFEPLLIAPLFPVLLKPGTGTMLAACSCFTGTNLMTNASHNSRLPTTCFSYAA